MHSILPQWQYNRFREETTEWVAKSFKKSLSQGELTKLDSLKAAPVFRTSGGVTKAEEIGRLVALSAEKYNFARKMIAGMATDKMSGKLKLEKAGVYTSLQYNFYDLRAPVFLLYPVNVPFRNSIPRVGRTNDGVGVAAHWKATKNPGIAYAGASEGNRVSTATPDENDYTATYKEIGVERAATFTAEFAGEGLTDNLADEHLRGLHELFLQEEGLDLLGNSGTSTGSNGFALGTAPTPSGQVTATHSVGAAGNVSSPFVNGSTSSGADLPYTTQLLATTNYVSVAVVVLTALGNPANSQYGYGVFPTVANGLTPQYLRTNADGSKDTINGGISAISAMSSPVQITSSNLTLAVTLPSSSLPIKGAFGYAWFVDVETSSTGSLANAKLAGITSVPYCYVSGTATGTQAGNYTGTVGSLAVDNSYNKLDYDGLITYCASTAGATWTDLQGKSLTSQKNGRVTEVETILQSIFTTYQAGIDEIWASPDAAEALDGAIRYSGATATGYQLMYTRDSQNNILGGFVVSGYQSRFAVNNPTGANVIPIRIHPMVPPGTLFFNLKTNPYPHSRVANIYEMLVQREYYSIEWPLVTRQWTFGTYVHQVPRHNMPWVPAVLTGIGTFYQTS